MKGRGLVEAEEKRSYGAVFLFVVVLLIACSVWAIWQDSFSRHLWKKYKTDFYRIAMAKFETELEEDATRLSEDGQYVELSEKLTASRASIESGEARAKLDDIAARKAEAEVSLLESDLSLRIVKGEVEEAWYHLEHAQHTGHSGKEEREHLDDRLAHKAELEAAFEAAKEVVADLEAESAEIHQEVTDLEESLRPFHKERESLATKLDGVSLQVLGRRVPAIPTIDQVVLKGFERDNFDNWLDRVERCTNCHVAIDKAGFEDQPNPWKTHPDRKYYIGNHETRLYGCTPCHGGQGASINSIDQAHGHVKYWEDPLLDTHDKVQAKCLTCHQSVQNTKGAEVAARGEWLFREMGCHGCHLVGGFDHLEKAGPSLQRVAAKSPPEWLVDWIRKPQNFRPRTRMPNFYLSEDEATAITAYLIDSSFEDSVEWLDEHPEPEGVDSSDAALVEQGAELTKSLGCLGCHGFEADERARDVAIGKDYAPNLARISEKTSARWLYHWVSDPRSYSEHARMPSLRLSDDEAAAITSYLLTLREEDASAPDAGLRDRIAMPETVADGEKLIRKYGCFGCHAVTGMATESRIGVELSAFGDKHTEELFFGDRLDIPWTWDDWTINKIMTPRTYETARIEQVMPEFGFDREDARALTVFLASRSDHQIHQNFKPDNGGRAARVRRGRELVSRYNCQGCHSFDGEEGAIRRFYEDNMEDAPPILHGQGMKVQSDWFFDFLMKPVRLRPWLDVRMPSFGMSSEDATSIVDYFAAVDGYTLNSVIVSGAGDDAAAMPAGHPGLPDGVFDCYSCHVEGAQAPADTDYVVSRTPLTAGTVENWAREHLGLEVGTADTEQEKSAAVRSYLGAGGQ